MNPKGFRVFVSHPKLRGTALWRYAMQYHWHVSWVSAMGTNTGITPRAKAGWQQGTSSKMVFLTVDTMGAKFAKTPRYFTSIHGDRMHWKVQGSHIIYRYTRARRARPQQRTAGPIVSLQCTVP
jgi:hypothetical protein